MLSFIRALPFVGIALLGAYGAHSFIVGQLNDTIDKQQMQIEQITSLTVQSNEYQRQAEEAMAIFKDHNFTILARRKPNLIEDRANNATRAVFDSVEDDSRDISQLDKVKRNESEDN